MNIRGIILLGLMLILMQYLWWSELENSFLLPEIGVIFMFLVHEPLQRIEILIMAMTFGLTADILGSIEPGKLLASFIITAIFITFQRHIKIAANLPKFLRFSAVLIVFHFSVLILAQPIFIRIWLATIIIQLTTSWTIYFLFRRMQKVQNA